MMMATDFKQTMFFPDWHLSSSIAYESLPHQRFRQGRSRASPKLQSGDEEEEELWLSWRSIHIATKQTKRNDDETKRNKRNEIDNEIAPTKHNINLKKYIFKKIHFEGGMHSPCNVSR